MPETKDYKIVYTSNTGISRHATEKLESRGIDYDIIYNGNSQYLAVEPSRYEEANELFSYS